MYIFIWLCLSIYSDFVCTQFCGGIENVCLALGMPPQTGHQLYILPRRGSNGGGVFLVNWREMLEANQECGEDSLSVLECSFVFRWDFLVHILCTVCKLCTLYT